ncbi:flagellar protein FlaG [Defluviitalea phaphyphila]|uniref:flagellar protein FlaG n=1 Tax=Defluviitalea phaphyphila TaxID=1473580 RepID=UPI000730B622|nr:flagellar protein FlaG [Defluviitalea phaphyphila]
MKIDGNSLETSNIISEIKTKQDTTENIDKNINSDIDIIEKMQLYPEYRPTISEKAIINAIEKANKKLSGVKAEFEFTIHEKTKEIMVKVINKETKEVIREIPPEKILDMVAKLWEMAGILVDEKR